MRAGFDGISHAPTRAGGLWPVCTVDFADELDRRVDRIGDWRGAGALGGGGRADGHRFAVSMLQLVTLVSGGLGILLFAGAGWIAAAVRSPGIAELLRILAIDLPLGGMAGVHLGVLTARVSGFLSGP